MRRAPGPARRTVIPVQTRQRQRVRANVLCHVCTAEHTSRVFALERGSVRISSCLLTMSGESLMFLEKSDFLWPRSSREFPHTERPLVNATLLLPSSEILFIQQTRPLCPRSSARPLWGSDLLTRRRSRTVPGRGTEGFPVPPAAATAWPVNITQAWTARCTHCFCGISSLQAELGSVTLVARGLPRVLLQGVPIS